jgi:hypothetical protein
MKFKNKLIIKLKIKKVCKQKLAKTNIPIIKTLKTRIYLKKKKSKKIQMKTHRNSEAYRTK